MADACEYCGKPAVRYDPFAQKPCCNPCFNLIIGGDEDDPPFRCGNAPEDGAS